VRHRHRLSGAAADEVAGGDTIVVVGQGPVGLSATQLAVAMGARVIALDISAERLQRAKEFGAAATIDAKSNDAPAAIKDLTHGSGADLTLDTSGTAEGRLIAVRGARKWGTACFVGEGGDVTIGVSPDMLRKQLTVVGSWTFSKAIQADCARFIADHKIDVEHLFTDRWTLDQADTAYQLFDKQTSGKGVFLVN
jgi:threonine dehydrogenase-like Zn-dependent dehydrogenase